MADNEPSENDSKYWVAYKLMREIAYTEDHSLDREYTLKLYQQCRSVVVNGVAAETALKK